MTTAPVRVGIDVSPLYGHRTGVGVAVEGLVDAFERRSDVDIAPYIVSSRATPRAGHRKLPVPGIVASHLWSRSEHPRADRWFDDVDLVHGTNYVAPPTSLPTVVSVYDCWFLEHPDQATPVVRRAGRNLRRAVARGAWIHTSSDATTERVRQLFDTERIVTAHLGAPPPPPPLAELDRPPIADELDGRPFVLAIGTEEQRKDLTLLVEAFGHLAERRAEPLLVLAGAPGNHSDDVTSAIANLPEGASPRVRRLGAVSDDTKYWLLRQASVLAYPSHDEGFGFPVLEAQAASTPVVARAVGSVPEIAGDAALLVDHRDPEAFADELERALTDGVVRLGLIESGHRNVHRFTWDAAADELVALYRRVLADSPPPSPSSAPAST